MILAIDVGNTNVVMGCIDGDKISHVSRMATDQTKTEHEYAAIIRQILHFDGIEGRDFDGAIIASVALQLTGTLRRAVEIFTGLEPIIVGAGIKTGLNILLDNPAQLGADLVCGAVAALAQCKPPIIVIDMGTATTLSVIDKNANFLGGAIVPGLRLAQNALSGGTSQLPAVDIEAPAKIIGRNTIECMRSGSILGTASMLDGMIARFEAELGQQAHVIATGGLAQKVIPYCSREIEFDDLLLLRGLAILYNKNKR